MIRLKGKEIKAISYGVKAVTAVYYGALLVWQAIPAAYASCFGSGAWKGIKPWIGAEKWKNNN